MMMMMMMMDDQSGVGGCIFVVVPGVAGFATFSPRLDELGNSVRGVAFFGELIDRVNFHGYDIVTKDSIKYNPRAEKDRVVHHNTTSILWAAAEGDVDRLKSLIAKGVDVNASDYDMRTALHVAASEGRRNAVGYLLKQGANPLARDRWEGLPLDDALRCQSGAPKIVAMLRQAMKEIEEGEGEGGDEGDNTTILIDE
eukprot:TRINITY_DN2315_c0_g4_i3.p1 TRINITY_DN2315_c0_g4~~TRINITY_DN2315_c0_g4_i3.p1  ORF type:complete len:198 (+),score=59.32 TRINITY_DN2315_c0_g4_i3:189-782(+)